MGRRVGKRGFSRAEDELILAFNEHGFGVSEIARRLGRSRQGIYNRLAKMEDLKERNTKGSKRGAGDSEK